MIRIGIDPDAKKHGVSVYVDEQLTDLFSMTTIELYEYLVKLTNGLTVKDVIVGIEDNNSIKAIYKKRLGAKDTLAKKLSIAQDVGRVKHAQVEVEGVLNHLCIKFVRLKPSSRFKKTDDPSFKHLTKWAGRSNPDTRSAAWFGYQIKSLTLAKYEMLKAQ